ncbi:hypothetical protein [uncultured Proteiniphilum sp.]|uniref:hypothetical protein n=1 Tax=uncultured Proteiniphilum sp. TaxID=497637 RepID=UPI00263618BB|nr:hypothetical protein [uncultured Proteiniphilum sp.]
MKKISILVLVYTIVLGTMTMMNSCGSDELESGYAVTVTDDGNGEASVSVGGKATAKAKEGAIVTLTALMLFPLAFQLFFICMALSSCGRR